MTATIITPFSSERGAAHMSGTRADFRVDVEEIDGTRVVSINTEKIGTYSTDLTGERLLADDLVVEIRARLLGPLEPRYGGRVSQERNNPR